MKGNILYHEQAIHECCYVLSHCQTAQTALRVRPSFHLIRLRGPSQGPQSGEQCHKTPLKRTAHVQNNSCPYRERIAPRDFETCILNTSNTCTDLPWLHEPKQLEFASFQLCSVLSIHLSLVPNDPTSL